MINKKFKIMKTVSIYLLFFLSASLKDIKLHKVIIIMMQSWVCNIYRCNTYSNNTTKKGEGNRII